MIVNYALYIKSLQAQGHHDVHLETDADGSPMIVCVAGRGVFEGRRVRYCLETDLFEPLQSGAGSKHSAEQ